MSSCGVANWGGPKPGDPSNNSVLQARPAVGGIEISWVMPTLNPFAIAYTIVYRSIDNYFENAIEIATWSGNLYFDRVASGTTYWYWIRFVSINGTENEKIGPVSSFATDFIEDIIEGLTARIDAGKLAIALRTDIEKIPLIGANIIQEIADRIASNAALVEFMAALDIDVNQVLTLIQEEITQRTDGDATILEAVNTIAVGQGDNIALITEERNLRLDGDSALAETINLNYTQVGQDISSAVQTVTQAYSGADQALATQVAQTYATKGGLTAAIQDVNLAISNGDYALAQRINTIEAGGGVDNAARTAIQEESTVRAQADNAFAQRITTLETTDNNGNIAQVEQKIDTYIITNNQKVLDIGAMYTVKLNVNGLIGGFGTFNDGNVVQMGFDVDEFWVGRTNANKRKPFMVMNDITYIDTAMIRHATIETLMIGPNQVTIPVGVYTAGNIACNWNSDNVIQQVTINSSGSPIVVSANARVSGSVVVYSYILMRDNVEIYNMSSEFFNGNPLSYALSINMIDTPGPGIHEYRLMIRYAQNVFGNDPDTGLPYSPPPPNKCAITLLEVKR